MHSWCCLCTYNGWWGCHCRQNWHNISWWSSISKGTTVCTLLVKRCIILIYKNWYLFNKIIFLLKHLYFLRITLFKGYERPREDTCTCISYSSQLHAVFIALGGKVTCRLNHHVSETGQGEASSPIRILHVNPEETRRKNWPKFCTYHAVSVFAICGGFSRDTL